MARRRTHIEVIQQVGERLRDNGNEQFKEFLDHISYVAVGTSDEDDETKFTRSFKAGNLLSYTNHFYNPKTGKGLVKLDAVKYADRIWQREIVSDYQKGKLGRAYWGMGRLLHLITDMGIPAHVHSDPHPEGDDYETYLADKHNEKFIQDLFNDPNIKAEAGVGISIKDSMNELARIAYKTNWYTKEDFKEIKKEHDIYDGPLGWYYYDREEINKVDYYYIERPVDKLCETFAKKLIPLTISYSTKLAVWCIEQLA